VPSLAVSGHDLQNDAKANYCYSAVAALLYGITCDVAMRTASSAAALIVVLAASIFQQV
jgi:hypothetical protein